MNICGSADGRGEPSTHAHMWWYWGVGIPPHVPCSDSGDSTVTTVYPHHANGPSHTRPPYRTSPLPQGQRRDKRVQSQSFKAGLRLPPLALPTHHRLMTAQAGQACLPPGRGGEKSRPPFPLGSHPVGKISHTIFWKSLRPVQFRVKAARLETGKRHALTRATRTHTSP